LTNCNTDYKFSYIFHWKFLEWTLVGLKSTYSNPFSFCTERF